ncbi:MAG: hypothetical protein AB1589_07595 [Cyanobacteriota bacterium]
MSTAGYAIANSLRYDRSSKFSLKYGKAGKSPHGTAIDQLSEFRKDGYHAFLYVSV